MGPVDDAGAGSIVGKSGLEVSAVDWLGFADSAALSSVHACERGAGTIVKDTDLPRAKCECNPAARTSFSSPAASPSFLQATNDDSK